MTEKSGNCQDTGDKPYTYLYLIKIELTISAPFDFIHVVAVPDTLTITLTREKRVEIVKMDAGAKRMAEIVRRRITTTPSR